MVKGAEDKDSVLRFLPNPLSLVSLPVQSSTRWADMSHSGNAQRLNCLLLSDPVRNNRWLGETRKAFP